MTESPLAPAQARFSTRGWVLFAVMALVWGVPYLFIKEAVDSYSPAAIVAGRTLIVNFPGSPKSIDQLFPVLAPTLKHVVRTLHGDSSHHESDRSG